MTFRKSPIVILAIVAAVLIAACGAKIIRGAAPIVRMNEMSHTENTISMQLSIRNLNGVALDMQAIDFSLEVEDEKFIAYKGPAKTNIVANGTETWTVEVEESQSAKQLLNKLEAGEIKSLPYTLEGSITAVDEGKLRFSHEGHIYPVPGKPGHFR